jgi:hypothetical protein
VLNGIRSERYANAEQIRLLDGLQILCIGFAAPLVSDNIKGYALSLVLGSLSSLLLCADVNVLIR